jgi:hypothetical protein
MSPTKARRNSGRVLLPGNEEHVAVHTVNALIVEQFMNAVARSPTLGFCSTMTVLSRHSASIASRLSPIQDWLPHHL